MTGSETLTSCSPRLVQEGPNCDPIASEAYHLVHCFQEAEVKEQVKDELERELGDVKRLRKERDQLLIRVGLTRGCYARSAEQ
jgi:hypothetical protein